MALLDELPPSPPHLVFQILDTDVSNHYGTFVRPSSTGANIGGTAVFGISQDHFWDWPSAIPRWHAETLRLQSPPLGLC
jgi:hypothetical protein